MDPLSIHESMWRHPVLGKTCLGIHSYFVSMIAMFVAHPKTAFYSTLDSQALIFFLLPLHETPFSLLRGYIDVLFLLEHSSVPYGQ